MKTRLAVLFRLSALALWILQCGYLANAQQPSLFDAMGEFESTYSISKTNGQQVPSTVIYDPYGKAVHGRGRISHTGPLVQMPNGTLRADTHVTGGNVWTPRVEELLGLDLSTNDKIIDQPGFRPELLESHPAGIKFANGVAVNLFGATVKANQVRDAGSEGTYLTKSNKKLYPRLIFETDSDSPVLARGDTVVTKEAAAIKVGTVTLGAVRAGTSLVAGEVREEWVGVSFRQEDQVLKGWILRESLTRTGRRFEEKIMNPGIGDPHLPTTTPKTSTPANTDRTNLDIMIIPIPK